jgi:hypothetical protein
MPHSAAYFPSLIALKFFGGEEQHEAQQLSWIKRKPDWGKTIRKRPDSFK